MLAFYNTSLENLKSRDEFGRLGVKLYYRGAASISIPHDPLTRDGSFGSACIAISTL